MGKRRWILLIVAVSVFVFIHLAHAAEKEKTAVKTLKPTPSADVTKGKASPLRAKPDLALIGMHLDDQCQVVLTVHNKGQGEITADEYAKTGIHVRSGPQAVKISLMQADPTGRLRKPGGKVNIPSGLVLTQQAQVQGGVDSAGVIAETDESNNNQTVILVPHCQAAKGNAPAKIGVLPQDGFRSVKPAGGSAGKILGKPPAAGQGSVKHAGEANLTMKKPAMAQRAAGESPSLVPLEDDSAGWLRFESPNASTLVTQKEIEVVYYVDADVADGDITFTLMHGDETIKEVRRYFRQADYGGYYGDEYRRVFFFTLHHLPEVINDDNYRLHARMTDRLEILSQTFRIASNHSAHSLFCTITNRESHFYQDETINFSCFGEPRNDLANFRVRLVRGMSAEDAGPVAVESVTGPAIYADLELGGIAAGLYRLKAEADQLPEYLPAGAEPRTLTAFSRYFTVMVRVPEPDPADTPIRITTPAEGYTFFSPSEMIRVGWQAQGWDMGDFVQWRLLSGGTEVHVMRSTNPDGALEFGTSGLETGDYQVEVQHRRRTSEEEAILLSAATVGINVVVDPYPTARCSREYPLQIVDVHSVGGTGISVGHPMMIQWCHLSSLPDPHIRIVLRDPVSGSEWVVGERISSAEPNRMDDSGRRSPGRSIPAASR